MRIRAAGRTEATHRGQWNGVRDERADVTNARRQSERHHKMREHGSRRQQRRMHGFPLLSNPMRIAFRNPHQIEPELERELPYRAGRQAVDRRIPRNPSQ